MADESKILFFAAAATALIGSVSSINVNDVDTRYFVGLFNGDEFPLLPDRCQPNAVVGSAGYQYPSCVDEETVSVGYYTADDPDCSGTPYLLNTYNATDYQTGLGSIFDFNCDSSSGDYYGEIDFSLTPCSAASADDFVKIYTTVGVCVFTGLYDYYTTGNIDFVSIRVYCQEDYAELQYFDSSDAASTGQFIGDCDANDQTSNATAVEECAYMLTTGGFDVYGKILDCTVPTTTAVPDGGDDSMPSSSMAGGDDDTATTGGGDDDDNDETSGAYNSFNIQFTGAAAAAAIILSAVAKLF